MNSYVG